MIGMRPILKQRYTLHTSIYLVMTKKALIIEEELGASVSNSEVSKNREKWTLRYRHYRLCGGTAHFTDRSQLAANE